MHEKMTKRWLILHSRHFLWQERAKIALGHLLIRAASLSVKLAWVIECLVIAGVCFHLYLKTIDPPGILHGFEFVGAYIGTKYSARLLSHLYKAHRLSHNSLKPEVKK